MQDARLGSGSQGATAGTISSMNKLQDLNKKLAEEKQKLVEENQRLQSKMLRLNGPAGSSADPELQEKYNRLVEVGPLLDEENCL